MVFIAICSSMMPNNFSCHPSVPAWAPGPVCSTSCKTLNCVREINYQHQLRQSNTKKIQWCHLITAVKKVIHVHLNGFIVQSYYITIQRFSRVSTLPYFLHHSEGDFGEVGSGNRSQQPGALGSWVLSASAVHPALWRSKKDDIIFTASKGHYEWEISCWSL